jgi:hypothetical protein
MHLTSTGTLTRRINISEVYLHLLGTSTTTRYGNLQLHHLAHPHHRGTATPSRYSHIYVLLRDTFTPFQLRSTSTPTSYTPTLTRYLHFHAPGTFTPARYIYTYKARSTSTFTRYVYTDEVHLHLRYTGTPSWSSLQIRSQMVPVRKYDANTNDVPERYNRVF